MYLQCFAVGRRSTKVIGFCISAFCAFSMCLDAFSAEPADSTYQIAGASGADPVKFGKWYESFRKAVVKNDKQALAKMISNPLSVYVGDGYDDYTGQKTESSDRSYGPSAFLKNYDHIFTKPLRNRLATAWKSEFWDRDQGVCLGTGMVWFDVLNDGANYKLKTINVTAGPNDIDGILGKIKTEENEKPNSDTIANLYSTLGRAYKDDWRCYSDERIKIENPFV